jgi:hypothetical protein
MRFECTICPHPQYAAMMSELKANAKRTVVANKYGVSYDALGRCWAEHRPHDQEYEVSESIKRNKKQLTAALQAKPQDRALVKDIEARLSALRKEQRDLQAIRKKENPAAMDGGETPLTIEALDKLIAAAPASVTDRDAPIQLLVHKIERTIPQNQWREVCGRLLEILEIEFAPSLKQEQVLERRPLSFENPLAQ